MTKKLSFYSQLFILLASTLFIAITATGQTTRKNQLSILILSSRPLLDKGYAAKLKSEGIQVACTSYYQTFPYGFLKKFNLIVLDKTPLAGARHGIWWQKELHFERNLDSIKKYVDDGGGLLIYTNLADAGGPRAGGCNDVLKPFGIQLKQTSVIDEKRSFSDWYPGNHINWTENLNKKHPVTKDLKRIYFPAAILRWDDCYTNPPLECDKNWTTIVESMPGATTRNYLDRKWQLNNESAVPHVLGAVRDWGKGRMAVLSINPIYTHRNGYTHNPHVTEMSTGPVDGIILDKGDGKVTSDTGKMLLNLYSWLGNNTSKGFGGYRTGGPIDAQKVVRIDKMPIQYYKFLVGVHSSYSDGKGSVKEFADAAKKAGYSAIVFTENFAKMKPGAYEALIKECAQYSDDELFCLPGYEIEDQDRNSIILAGAPRIPPKSWLTEDGSRLVQTHMVYLTLYNTLTIIHHPDSNPLPKERMKHFQAMSIYTYRNGKLIDNSLSAYMWQVQNASNPHPVAVHEVYSPDKVALAAKTGFQQIIPSDKVKNAAGYFRFGQGHYFESPAKYMISEGPIVYKWGFGHPKSMDKNQFYTGIGVESDVPLKYVKIYDGFNLIRKWLPQKSRNFQQTAYFRYGPQFDLFLVAEDKSGRKVITNSIRTVPERFHSRCSDRQNWLGYVAIFYTGTDAMGGLPNLAVPVEGVPEGEDIFTPVRGACMAVKANHPFSSKNVVITESEINEKYVRALFKEVVYDAKPSMISKSSNIYDCMIRNWSFAVENGNGFNLSVVDYNLKLKRNIEPKLTGGMFPCFVKMLDNRYAWYKDGKLISGTIQGGKTINVPVGGMVGGFIVLSPGMAAGNGWIGLRTELPGSGQLKRGTAFRAKLLYPSSIKANTKKLENLFKDQAKWLNTLGFGPVSPYRLETTRGLPEKSAYPLQYEAVEGGVAGTVEKTADLPVKTAVCVNGLNANFPAGIWRQNSKSIDYVGVFGNTAYFMLDTSTKGNFYVGSLIFANNPDLVIEIVYWTPEGITMEIHNPSGQDIEAKIKSAGEITNLYKLDAEAKIKRGASIILKRGKTL